ncbi:putative RNA-directed DNA polymerase from transposon X-element [Trichonephila clavipes]|nr:putative RNA-directed DNA polymerase from transposon X-element [Trichonephila clavipes]
MHGYRLDTSCSIFTAEAVAIYRALQLIDSTMPRKYCIYTDSMSVLEALENYHDRCHPVVCTILDITSRLYSKGFDIVFCWLPSHVGIIGNEQADSAAKSATTHLPLAVPLSDMKRVIMHHIFNIWQESWSQQLDNKLHSVKPVIGAWPVMPLRRTYVKLTRLRIGHTRFTHRHLLFGERAPECPSCHVSYTVHHILIDCPVFNHHRITFFNSSHLTLPDLVGEIPHQNLFAFIKKKLCCQTPLGADRTSLLRVYQAIVLSRIDYGCVAYGSACNSTLQKLDPVHHMALRICSGAFRTSPVQSLYVNCHQLPLDLRRRKLSLAFYFKILSVPSHPLQNVYMSTSMKRLYDARPSNIRPFMDRMKLHISELDLPNVRIQQRNFPIPTGIRHGSIISTLFATYSKSTVAPVVIQRVFAYHRSQYSRYSAIYTDGSKRADYVGCGVVIEDIMHGYRLDTSCSIFTAEAVAIYRALQLIDSTLPRKYCIYTDSMSVLEALENYHDRCHPVSRRNHFFCCCPLTITLNTSASSLSAETRTLIRSNKSAAALSTEIQPLPESDPTASNGEHFNAPEVPQCAKRNSRNREESVQKYRKQKLKSNWLHIDLERQHLQSQQLMRTI